MSTNASKTIVTVAAWLGPAFGCVFTEQAAIAFIGSMIVTVVIWADL